MDQAMTFPFRNPNSTHFWPLLPPPVPPCHSGGIVTTQPFRPPRRPCSHLCDDGKTACGINAPALKVILDPNEPQQPIVSKSNPFPTAHVQQSPCQLCISNNPPLISTIPLPLPFTQKHKASAPLQPQRPPPLPSAPRAPPAPKQPQPPPTPPTQRSQTPPPRWRSRTPSSRRSRASSTPRRRWTRRTKRSWTARRRRGRPAGGGSARSRAGPGSGRGG